MTPGELFYWPQHEFDDGGTSDKLLIILNLQRNGVHLAAYTTSQSNKRWPEDAGCNVDKEVFCILKNNFGFTRSTWIQLFRVREYEVDLLENMVLKDRIKSLRQLSDELLRAIVNCYKKTDSFFDYHDWLLEDP